jgi:hypothetical protein
MARCLYFSLSKVERILRSDGSYRYDSEDEDDAETSPSHRQDENYNDGDEDNRRTPPSNASLALRRRKDFTYRLSCISLASRNPMPVPMPAPGPPGYWHNIVASNGPLLRPGVAFATLPDIIRQLELTQANGQHQGTTSLILAARVLPEFRRQIRPGRSTNLLLVVLVLSEPLLFFHSTCYFEPVPRFQVQVVY